MEDDACRRPETIRVRSAAAFKQEDLVGQKLNALDLAFLALETNKTPVNVAGLVVLQIPDAYEGNFVRDLLDELLKQEPGPPFDRRLSNSLIGRPEWVTDQHFDIDYHVRHSALPKPGKMTDLLALVSRLHSRLMDRERPLWEFHIIEGLENNRFAVYTKMHHAAIDGIGGIELLEACFVRDPDAPVRAPWAGAQRKPRGRSPAGLMQRVTKGARQLVNQAQLSTGLGKLLLGHGLKAVGLRPSHSPVPFTAPKSLFNVPISAARRFEIAQLPLQEIKSLGRALGATANDIILATCSGALRRYLQSKKSLPGKSLVATVPVSVRQLDRSGNQITYVAARLGTHRRTPLGRLKSIAESTRQAKQEVASVSPGAASMFAVMSQGMVAVLNRFQMTEWLPPPANVVISNVPGPRRSLYFGGAKMEANYPLSVLVDGQALNITVVSYCDSVDFGLMADRDAVPDADQLAKLIVESFDELKAAAAKHEATEASTPSKKLRKKKPTPSVVAAEPTRLANTGDEKGTSETAKKQSTTNPAVKKRAVKKKVVNKGAAKKKSVASSTAETKAAEQKTPRKKPMRKQSTSKKSASKKSASKKSASKKSASKKTASKKGTAKKRSVSKASGTKPANGSAVAGRQRTKKATKKAVTKKTLRQARAGDGDID